MKINRNINFNFKITINNKYNIDVISHKDNFITTGEFNKINNITSNYENLLIKFPLKNITKSSKLTKNTAEYDFNKQAISFNINNKEVFSLLIKHEFAHHFSLNSFSIKDWHELIKAGGWKILSHNNNLVNVNANSLHELGNKAKYFSWYITKNNIYFSYIEYGNEIKMANKIKESNNINFKDFNKTEPNVHLLTKYRYKNVIEMIAEDLIIYLNSPSVFLNITKAAVKDKVVESLLLIKEYELFKKHFSSPFNNP